MRAPSVAPGSSQRQAPEPSRAQNMPSTAPLSSVAASGSLISIPPYSRSAGYTATAKAPTSPATTPDSRLPIKYVNGTASAAISASTTRARRSSTPPVAS